MAPTPPLSLETERELVVRMQQGDRGALGELLNAYHKRLYHVCLRMVCHPEDAADLTQEALLKAVRHADTFKGNSRFGTWLYRIGMNLVISHMRKASVRRAISLDTTAVGDDQATALKAVMRSDREPSPAHRVEVKEQLVCLAVALESLDVPLRSAILLRDLEGMDYQEMAEVLNIPVGTVKSRLFRARLALRKAMSNSRPGERPEVPDG